MGRTRQTIWTVGHSNLEADAFVALLKPHSIELLADVRLMPGSRRWPQFNAEALAERLSTDGIDYHHFPKLGGRRSKRATDSPNTAWRVDAFNAYADYMQTAEFREGFAELEEAAAERRTAIMCAEALPWRCHRRIIADLLVVRGWKVLDIIGRQAKKHVLPEFARVHDGEPTYPGGSLF